MKFGIVGNNDGPLFLLKGLLKSPHQPTFVGLQKPVDDSLKKNYEQILEKADLFVGFDEQGLLDKLNNYEPDLLINCFCNFKFDELLNQSFQILNIHLSPLPAYRGRHPLQWALINGEKEFGVSIHNMTEKFDAGEIYWQKHVSVTEGMSVKELRSNLMHGLKSGFGDFLHCFSNNNIKPSQNDDDLASYMPRRYPEDSQLVEWDDSQKIYRKVMALRSEDYQAYVIAGNQKVNCSKASIGKRIPDVIETPYINAIRENKFQVICLDGETIWLTGNPKKISRLSANQKIQ